VIDFRLSVAELHGAIKTYVMKEITPEYNYTVEQNGEFTKLIYKKTPVSYKMAGPVCWYAAIPAFLITMWFQPQSLISGFIIWLIVLGCLSAAVVFMVNSLRKPGEININNKMVQVDGCTYQLEHVSSFLVKDPAGLYSTHTTVIVNNNNSYSLAGNVANLSQGMGQVANESRRAIQKHLRDVGYKIVIRYGSKDIPIAKGLGETEADVLFYKLTEVAGYK
jgi:hypothetical protein